MRGQRRPFVLIETLLNVNFELQPFPWQSGVLRIIKKIHLLKEIYNLLEVQASVPLNVKHIGDSTHRPPSRERRGLVLFFLSVRRNNNNNDNAGKFKRVLSM